MIYLIKWFCTFTVLFVFNKSYSQFSSFYSVFNSQTRSGHLVSYSIGQTFVSSTKSDAHIVLEGWPVCSSNSINPTGIISPNNGHNVVSVFPNPINDSNQFLTVQINASYKVSELKLYTSNFKELPVKNRDGVEFATYPSGVYYIKINFKDYRNYFVKVIKL